MTQQTPDFSKLWQTLATETLNTNSTATKNLLTWRKMMEDFLLSHQTGLESLAAVSRRREQAIKDMLANTSSLTKSLQSCKTAQDANKAFAEWMKSNWEATNTATKDENKVFYKAVQDMQQALTRGLLSATQNYWEGHKEVAATFTKQSTTMPQPHNWWNQGWWKHMLQAQMPTTTATSTSKSTTTKATSTTTSKTAATSAKKPDAAQTSSTASSSSSASKTAASTTSSSATTTTSKTSSSKSASATKTNSTTTAQVKKSSEASTSSKTNNTPVKVSTARQASRSSTPTRAASASKAAASSARRVNTGRRTATRSAR